MNTSVESSRGEGALNSPTALPVIVEDVTAAWFSQVLPRPVQTATLIEPIHGTASKLLYALTYSDSSKDAVCVKGGFNPALVALHPALNAVYRREAEFFHHIAPTVEGEMRLPPVIFAGSVSVPPFLPSRSCSSWDTTIYHNLSR